MAYPSNNDMYEPADREHITGSVGKEFPNNEPAPTAPQLSAAAAGSDPASEAEEPGPDSSAPTPIEAPRGVEGEAEGASASPANSETPEPGAPAALEGAHNPTSGAVPANNVTTFTRKPHDGPVSSKGLARHKLCQHVDLCAGTWREACFDCRKAAADAQGLTA